nr:hypothetical protein [Rubritalea marina]
MPQVGAVFAEYFPINPLGFDFLECLLNRVQGIGSGMLGEMAAKLIVMHCPFFRVLLGRGFEDSRNLVFDGLGSVEVDPVSV